MTIKRQDFNEEYNITADWLNDFARKLEKKSYNIENLTNIRQMNSVPKKFATIEEKMTDIKQRIGFDIIKNMDNIDMSKKVSAAACGCKKKEDSCACPIKTASHTFSREELEGTEKILVWIRACCKDPMRGDLVPPQVMSECRLANPQFDSLPLDIQALMAYIDQLIKLNSKERGEPSCGESSYIPRGEFSAADGDPNREAEYFSHSSPSG